MVLKHDVQAAPPLDMARLSILQSYLSTGDLTVADVGSSRNVERLMMLVCWIFLVNSDPYPDFGTSEVAKLAKEGRQVVLLTLLVCILRLTSIEETVSPS